MAYLLLLLHISFSCSNHEMELTRTLFYLLCTCQIFGLMQYKEIIEYVHILSETKFNSIRIDNLNKHVIKDLISYYPIVLQKSNKSQELNKFTLCLNFCDFEIDNLDQYLLKKNILIVKLSTNTEEK